MMLREQLQPGDCLLYAPKGAYGWIIAIKTWHSVAHCEGYIGDGESVASRDGIGVGRFPLRESELQYVMRPVVPFQLAAAMARFDREWRGQGYDWLGLVRFAWRAPVARFRFNNKQFCSEFLTRWYREGQIDPFNGDDADAIAPSDFLKATVFRRLVVKDGVLQAEVLSV
jgi:hypothetical protein